ncbi:MAG: NAD-dependent protein deacylase [Oscillospiraceae bacterium]|jgi:NAD-dependent deacetylase|nr:NAD-dependent protein deacylase [Oscillospiraceae bacterium]
MIQEEQLAHWLNDSRRTVFFGGAGVSTASGIPDFRSETGLYKAQEVYGQDPEILLSHGLFRREPTLFFRYYKENLIHRAAKPNRAHLVLAEWEARGLLDTVITQNIDGLHQTAGSRRVLELHGSNWRHYCLDCRRSYTMDYILSPEHCPDGMTPRCAQCGGVVRPDVVLYGEPLNEAVMTAAMEAVSQADTLIVGGTSLAVYPAAGLLRYYRGKRLVLINKTATPYDSAARLVVHGDLGETLAATDLNIP